MGMEAALVLAVRLVNAALWTLVLIKIARNGPVTGLTRMLMCVLLGSSFWLFVLGGLVQYNVSVSVARLMATAFTAIAGIIGVALLTRGKI
jgi:hypothetical protein